MSSRQVQNSCRSFSHLLHTQQLKFHAFYTALYCSCTILFKRMIGSFNLFLTGSIFSSIRLIMKALKTNCQKKNLDPSSHHVRNTLLTYNHLSVAIGPSTSGRPGDMHFLKPRHEPTESGYLMKVFWTLHGINISLIFFVHSDLISPHFLFCIQVFKFHVKTPIL